VPELILNSGTDTFIGRTYHLLDCSRLQVHPQQQIVEARVVDADQQ